MKREMVLRSTLKIVLSENRPATRIELEEICERNVFTQDVNKRVMGYIKDHDLKRFIVLEIFFINCVKSNKSRSRVMEMLAMVTGAHRKTVERWIRDENYETGNY